MDLLIEKPTGAPLFEAIVGTYEEYLIGFTANHDQKTVGLSFKKPVSRSISKANCFFIPKEQNPALSKVHQPCTQRKREDDRLLAERPAGVRRQR